MSDVVVRIVGTGSFLPGDPIPNDQLEFVLGPLDSAPDVVRRFVKTIGPRMLERGGITTRHLAIDPVTGDLTHDHCGLAEPAALRALDAAGLAASDIDLLILACPSYDRSTPPTSTLLQERLGIRSCAEMEIHSNCSGVGKGVQVAYDALRLKRYKTALVCYSQLSSVYLRSCYFSQPKMSKVHAALRWILADGAGALVLQADDSGGEEHALLGTYVESIGGDLPAGMSSGGAAADLMRKDQQIPELYAAGRHHLWQDLAAVGNRAAPLLLEGLIRFIDTLPLDSASVDHYVVSIPSRALYDQHIPAFMDQLGITRDQIRFRSDGIGYCGGAATLVQFDHMVRSGELQTGDIAVVHAVESSKWMTAGFACRW